MSVSAHHDIKPQVSMSCMQPRDVMCFVSSVDEISMPRFPSGLVEITLTDGVLPSNRIGIYG